MNTMWSRIRAVVGVFAAVGVCVAALFAVTPQQAMAQSNVLNYEHEFGKLDGYFHQPQGVAVDGQGYVYVTDFEDHRVQVFDPRGNFVRKWGWFGQDAGDLMQPTGIAVDDQLNRVYVAEMGNERIQVFDKNGAYLFHFGSSGQAAGQLRDAHDIAAGGKGLYVADTWNHRIQIFDQNGNFLHMWGGQGNGPGQFEAPKAIAVYRDLVYVADTGNDRVQIFRNDGTYVTSFGTTGGGNGQFIDPSGIDVDANGIIVVDGDNNNYRVQEFDHAGLWLNTFGGAGSAPGLMHGPMGIAKGPNAGHVELFVADTGNHRVQRLDKGGNVLQILGSAQAPHGHLTQPMGIDYSEKLEALFVADFGNDRIQVFDAQGRFLRGWNVAAQPVDVAVDPTDFHVWVVSLIGQVERYDAGGTLVAAWSVPSGPGPGQIGTPKGIAVDAQQNVYISNQWAFGPGNTNGRIHIADASGNYLATWGTTGLSAGSPPPPDTFDMPADLQLGAYDKSLYVAVDGQRRVKQVDIEGNMSMGNVLEYNAGSYRPFALALRPDDSLFMADPFGRLWYFDQFNNAVHQQDPVHGGGPGEFRNIGDMEHAADSKHHPELLIFSEWENHRIQVFTLVGP